MKGVNKNRPTIEKGVYKGEHNEKPWNVWNGRKRETLQVNINWKEGKGKLLKMLTIKSTLVKLFVAFRVKLFSEIKLKLAFKTILLLILIKIPVTAI